MTKNFIARVFVKGPAKPMIPEGEYPARILNADKRFAFGEKILIRFIVSHEGSEYILAMFCNIKVNESQEMLEPGLSSKLGKTFRRLLPNTPFGEITLDSLAGLMCLVRVKTAKSDSDRKVKPREDWYSVVHEVIKVIEDVSFDDDIPF